MTDAKRLSLHGPLNRSVDDVKTASILGFVFVSMVDESQKKVRLVIPCGGDLPGTILLSGSIRWNLECSVCCNMGESTTEWTESGFNCACSSRDECRFWQAHSGPHYREAGGGESER